MSIIRQFWWGSKQGRRKPSWVAWDIMTRTKHLGGLGIRDLDIFNLALLARQAWRTMTEDSSLSARILKLVYFPGCSLLEAELRSHPSQIWWAILDGRDILAQGMVWRIGDGETTDIWAHNWIPRDSFKRPITSLVQDPPLKVAHFIDATTASWNEDLLRSTFTPFDALEILKIPLCTRKIADFWAWHEVSRGIFSVRSAYRMILRTKLIREAWLNESEGALGVQNESNKWSTIWHIQVPSKLRMFVWCLARQSMPTGELLKHRNMAEEDSCMLCGAKDTWKLALFTCPMSSSVWALAPEDLVQHMVDRQEESPKEWLFALHEILDSAVFVRLVVTTWAICGARRRAIHEDI